MPWDILENLWNRTLYPNPAGNLNQQPDWTREVETLYSLGIGMEVAMRYLYFEKPDWPAFKAWVEENKKDNNRPGEDLPQNVLSEDDLHFWQKNGYIIVKDAISKTDCEATQQAIWDFLKMNQHEKETWYRGHNELRGLMLNFSDHETLNRNRFSPRIKKAYEQLYQTKNLYKTIDKVSFNPPETETFKFMGSALHWDVSLKQPVPLALQGLLYLTDCGPHDGAFHCVPGFHNKLSRWMQQLQPHENPREKARETLKAQAVTANAGDFIIWQNTLPHCATANHGTSPRMVQYLTYLPDGYKPNDEWL